MEAGVNGAPIPDAVLLVEGARKVGLEIVTAQLHWMAEVIARGLVRTILNAMATSVQVLQE